MIRTAEAFTGLAAGGPTCPKSRFNVPIGRDRRVAWAKTDLDRLKRARAAAEGATVNDVVLSVAAGRPAPLLRGPRREPPKSLVALVPVSIRKPGEEHDMGNRISTILVPLPIAEPDPRKRLEILRDETARLKESDNARAASLIIEATGWTPPTINRLLSSAMARPLVFNLVVSNVPGPQQPLYLLGKRILEIYPFVPLSPQNHAVSMGLISYDGRVFFGLAGDRDVVPDLDDLAAGLRAALREQPVPRARKPAPKKRAKPKPPSGSPRPSARTRSGGGAPVVKPAAKKKPAARRRGAKRPASRLRHKSRR